MSDSTSAPSIWGALFKTGMRVPVTGEYRDQRGVVVTFKQHGTFSPLCGKGSTGCAWYRLVRIL